MKDDGRTRFFELMRRYNQLARLLPSEDQIAEGEGLADARLILAEMANTQSEMDAIIAAARAAKNGPGKH